MQTAKLKQFIAQSIPAAAALNLTIEAADTERVVIRAPFADNRNHHHTLFGGSQALVATLSAWSLVHLNFPEADGHIVIRRSEMDYRRPAADDVLAISLCPDEQSIQQTKQQFAQKGKARITIDCAVYCAEQMVSHWQGEFVLLSK